MFDKYHIDCINIKYIVLNVIYKQMQVSCIHVYTVQIKSFGIRSLISHTRSCSKHQKASFQLEDNNVKHKYSVKLKQADNLISIHVYGRVST